MFEGENQLHQQIIFLYGADNASPLLSLMQSKARRLFRNDCSFADKGRKRRLILRWFSTIGFYSERKSEDIARATHTDISVILKQHYSVVCRPFRKSLPWKHLRRIECRTVGYHCRWPIVIVSRFDRFRWKLDSNVDDANDGEHCVSKAIALLRHPALTGTLLSKNARQLDALARIERRRQRWDQAEQQREISNERTCSGFSLVIDRREVWETKNQWQRTFRFQASYKYKQIRRVICLKAQCKQ